MSTRESRSDQEPGRRTAPTPRSTFFGWLRTGTGVAVGVLWLALLAVALVVIRPGPVTAAIEVAGMLFGVYASSVAFRNDRAAGYVICIALAFSFALLNVALYIPTLFPNPMGR